MNRVIIPVVVLCLAFMSATWSFAISDISTIEVDPAYKVTQLVNGSHFYGGLNGLAFDNNDQLFVATVGGVSIFKVDAQSGQSELYMGPPNGGADDIVFGPDNTMYWTAFFLGKVFKKTPDGKITLLAEGMPGANALDLNSKGELYVTQVFFGDALWHIDTSGKQKNTLIAKDLGGLNGFEIGTDDYIYGPLWFKKQVVKINPENGQVVDVIGADFTTPCAVNFDSKGNLWALDTGTGEIFKIDPASKHKELIATQEPHLDNLAINSKDQIFITNMNTNGIYEVLPDSHSIRTLSEDSFVLPQGIAFLPNDTGGILYVADNFAYKKLDLNNKQVITPHNGSKFVYSTNLSADGEHLVMAGWSENRIQIFDLKSDQLEYTIKDVPRCSSAYLQNDHSLLALQAVSGELVQIDPAHPDKRTVLITDLANPTFLAADPANPDHFYISQYGSGQITKINVKSGQTNTVYDQAKGPEGITVGNNGHLYVIDSVARELLDIDPITHTAKTIIKNLPLGLKGASVGGPAASPLNGITYAPEKQTLYLTCDLANTILAVTLQ